MADIDSTIPQKQCSKCKQWFPATLEYFLKRSNAKDGLRNHCRQCSTKYGQDYRKKHEDKEKRYRKQYYIDNKEQLKEYTRNRNRQFPEMKAAYNKKYKKLHPEKSRTSGRPYLKNNPELYSTLDKLSKERRRSRKHQLPDDFSKLDWYNALDYFSNRCAVCGRKPDFWTILAMDHWIPITDLNCPGTVKRNIVPLCNGRKGVPAGEPSCNLSKCQKHPKEWLIERYGKRKAKRILERIQAYFDQIE